MQRLKPILLLVLAMSLASLAASTEPLVGTWTLSSQTVNGNKVESEPLTLRVYPASGGLEFAFSVPVNGIHLVSMKFTSVRLDGSAGAVENVRGVKIGTVKVSKLSPTEYKAVIEGTNRPTAINKMTVSKDGQTLTSDSESEAPGKAVSHVVQIFARH